ncbi:serine hydrolase domain-containing protein [Stenotrophomonas rhizophila]|uniref:serine hydrolase domain-containing protein n=1 Tax=Stenotrophomonas rhizophila TaxID=216778 RepID=UPI001E4AD583|nr:serine hydrolase domain-containing protein [Stenotrophomonas rhizophila]MCC7632949.1 beta-lactamase family protein [Stenotrophomonas rhizophila]MCC7662326.1 beta-lactamase family protein [Stenotrophomonas rhizophila]
MITSPRTAASSHSTPRGMRRWLGISLLLLAANAGAADGLQARIAQAMQGTTTPAMGVLVIRDGKVAEQAVSGLRRSDSKTAVTRDDRWMIGSTGKPITVAMIARLVEQGVLKWDTPLSTLLPELSAQMRPEYRNVTLVQLLSHRAGLPENLTDAAALDAFFTDTRPLPVQREAYIKAALAEAPVHAPGTEFAYSNSGFLIAAVIAERATGKDVETLMQREVFQPLGMTGAGFGPTTGNQPLGHRAGKPVTTAPRKADDGVPPIYTAAGNLHMRLQDLALFAIDQLAGSKGKGKLLSPASYALMQTAQPGSGSGLDWGVQPSIAGRQGPVLVHGGSDGNWLAWVVLFPGQNNGVIAIANAAEDMGADQATMGVLGGLFAELAPAAAPAAPGK